MASSCEWLQTCSSLLNGPFQRLRDLKVIAHSYSHLGLVESPNCFPFCDCSISVLMLAFSSKAASCLMCLKDCRLVQYDVVQNFSHLQCCMDILKAGIDIITKSLNSRNHLAQTSKTLTQFRIV